MTIVPVISLHLLISSSSRQRYDLDPIQSRKFLAARLAHLGQAVGVASHRELSQTL
jgi:hypothetical protein